MDRPVQDLAKWGHVETAAVARPLSIRPRCKSLKMHHLLRLWPLVNLHGSPSSKAFLDNSARQSKCWAGTRSLLLSVPASGELACFELKVDWSGGIMDTFDVRGYSQVMFNALKLLAIRIGPFACRRTPTSRVSWTLPMMGFGLEPRRLLASVS